MFWSDMHSHLPFAVMPEDEMVSRCVQYCWFPTFVVIVDDFLRKFAHVRARVPRTNISN